MKIMLELTLIVLAFTEAINLFMLMIVDAKLILKEF